MLCDVLVTGSYKNLVKLILALLQGLHNIQISCCRRQILQTPENEANCSVQIFMDSNCTSDNLADILSHSFHTCVNGLINMSYVTISLY